MKQKSSPEFDAFTEHETRGGPPADARAGGDDSRAIGEVVTAVTAMLSAAGGMKMLLEMVKLWVEVRKERKIRLKKGDLEIEIQGNMSQKEIQQKITLFRELAKDDRASEIRIVAEVIQADEDHETARRIR